MRKFIVAFVVLVALAAPVCTSKAQGTRPGVCGAGSEGVPYEHICGTTKPTGDLYAK